MGLFRIFLIIRVFLGVLLSSPLLGQGTTAVEGAEDPARVQTYLDPAPFVSVRAAGLGGAMSTLADGVHAPYYNPAGIGGIHWGRQRPPKVRQVHFPYVGGGVNVNTRQLQQDFQNLGGAEDRGVGNAIVDANAGKRQYGRSSSLFTFGYGRTLMMLHNDLQLSAFKSSEEVDSGSVRANYRSSSGGGFGFSVTDKKEMIYLGMYHSMVSRREFKGDFEYLDVVNVGDRTQTLKEKSTTQSKQLTNFGMLWILAKKGRPALAVVVRDYDSSYLLGAEGALPETEEEIALREQLKIQQDVTVGFSVSPRIGKRGAFNFLIEAQNLSNREISLEKKYRVAMELNLGGFGSEALFGLRLGASAVGPSAGVGLNFGLVQLEVATQAVDLGVDNRVVPERRYLAVLSVNVLDN
ncbi:MAG: hypothetical protein AB8C84_09095 [Oligoflexales bacterium]